MRLIDKFFVALPFIVFGLVVYCAWVQAFTDKIFDKKDK